MAQPSSSTTPATTIPPGRDNRAEKLRRCLREGVPVLKEDFFDFLQVYPFFQELGFRLRPALAEWIKQNHATVLAWLPEILAIRPGYFDPVEPGSRFPEHDTLVALGLTSPQTAQRGSPILSLGGAADDADNLELPAMPISVAKARLSDFGTIIPAAVVNKRPKLVGKMQEELWLEDVQEAQKWFRKIRKWFIDNAGRLSPHDEAKETLSQAALLIPDFTERVENAQLCLDDVKIRFESSLAEVMERRATISGRFESPEDSADDQPPTPLQGNEITVGAGIEGGDQFKTPTPRPAGGNVFANEPRLEPIMSPKRHVQEIDSTVVVGKFPRRSAMPQAQGAKRPRVDHSPTVDVESRSGGTADSGSGDDDAASFPDLRRVFSNNPKSPPVKAKEGDPAQKAVSVYSVDVSDEEPAAPGPRAKRPYMRRPAMGEARRPPPSQTAGGKNGGQKAPEAVMG